jgi:hypothetical protein
MPCAICGVAESDHGYECRARRGRFPGEAKRNLLRMGHWAPTVAKTLLDASEIDVPWPVKLTTGLPEASATLVGKVSLRNPIEQTCPGKPGHAAHVKR